MMVDATTELKKPLKVEDRNVFMWKALKKH